MDGIVVTWVGIALVFLASAGGWVFTIVRNGKANARSFGRLESKVDALKGEISELRENISHRLDRHEKRMDNLDTKVDKLDDCFRDMLRQKS